MMRNPNHINNTSLAIALVSSIDNLQSRSAEPPVLEAVQLIFSPHDYYCDDYRSLLADRSRKSYTRSPGSCQRKRRKMVRRLGVKARNRS